MTKIQLQVEVECPTHSQRNTYLRARGWTECPASSIKHTRREFWSETTNPGHRLAMHNGDHYVDWPGNVRETIGVIAALEQRTPYEVARDMLNPKPDKSLRDLLEAYGIDPQAKPVSEWDGWDMLEAALEAWRRGS